MKQLVVDDEFIMTTEALKVHFKLIKKKKKEFPKFKGVVLGGDNSFLCDYMLNAVANANTKCQVFEHIDYLSNSNENDNRKRILDETGVVSIHYNYYNEVTPLIEKSLFYFFINCNSLTEKTETITELKKLLELLKGKSNTKLVLSVILPKIPFFSKGPTSLAERELNFYLEKHCDKTEELYYYFEVEKLLREKVINNNLDITLLRFDNVFSPDCYSTPCIDFKCLIEESVNSKKVVINDDDYKRKFTISYIRDACEKIFLSAFKAKGGHTYNVASQEVTVADIKEILYNIYPDKFALEKNLSQGIEREYSCMNCLKFDFLGVKTEFNLTTAVKHAISYFSDLEYDISDNTEFYAGRIKTIQALEIEILKEIDRICVENDIKYFLAGGSLLGAVRSGEPISWDDDLDIGMLREDYEKFREICEENLSDKFEFSSPFNNSGSHYAIEKVRLKSTYFSTTFSAKNVFSDGIFVDVLVYDKTSNIKSMRVMQSLMLVVLYYCIILRWYNKARKEYMYRASKILLPILRMFPLGFYHWWFEFVIKLFKNKKDATLLIDGVGKKLKDGPLPKAGLEDTVYVDFGTTKAPIPVDSTGYLTFDYGPNYIEKPNYGKRKCPHDFARIDLGKYIFDVAGATPFREVDLRGELFESENEV